MEILDFELKIKTTGIRVKHIIISYNGYDYVYDKIRKNLFMKPYDICPDDIYIYINSNDPSNDQSYNTIYRNVLRFSKDGLYYDIESFQWIEFYDIDTENLFMKYISKYYIQPTIEMSFDLYPPIECLFLEEVKKHKYSKDDIIKINEKYNYEQSLLEVLVKKKNTKSVSFNL